MLSIFRPIKTHLELQRVFSNTLLGHQWEKSEPQNNTKQNAKKTHTKERNTLPNHITPTLTTQAPSFMKNLSVFKSKQLVFFFIQQIQEKSTLWIVFPSSLLVEKKLFCLSRNITSSFVQFPNTKDFVVIFALVISTHVLDVNAFQNVSIRKIGWRVKLDSQNFNNIGVQNVGMKVRKNTTHDTEK